MELSVTACRPALRVIKHPSPRVKQPEHEAYHLLPTSAKIKNAWSFSSILPYYLGNTVYTQGQFFIPLSGLLLVKKKKKGKLHFMKFTNKHKHIQWCIWNVNSGNVVQH